MSFWILSLYYLLALSVQSIVTIAIKPSQHLILQKLNLCKTSFHWPNHEIPFKVLKRCLLFFFFSHPFSTSSFHYYHVLSIKHAKVHQSSLTYQRTVLTYGVHGNQTQFWQLGTTFCYYDNKFVLSGGTPYKGTLRLPTSFITKLPTESDESLLTLSDVNSNLLQFFPWLDMLSSRSNCRA